MKNVKGFSLPELMTAVAVGGFLSLAMASVFTFAAQQFNGLIDQNDAEDNFLLASFYLRATLAQAVKTQHNTDPFTNFGTDVSGLPANIIVGYMNCNLGCNTATKCTNQTAADNDAAAKIWSQPINTFAMFNRDNGGNGTSDSASSYLVTGIFYQPATATTDGKLYISQFPASSGGSFTLTEASLSNQIVLNRIVAFGLYPDAGGNNCDIVPSGGINYVRGVNMYVRARYFQGISQVKNHLPNQTDAAAAGANYRDLEQTIYVVLRNNILGASQTDGTPERVNGGLLTFLSMSFLV
ncbi:MAG: prepilin-type N-terminal cleavage/methylation domain-containing protein [Oligoflexia bacterium]|nr:prepilin-type N-terminal cleavage/methylation domain-containing protein [Oligoflexia bacterium]